MSSIEIAVTHFEGKVRVTVIHVKGDIDASSYKELDAQAETVISEGAKHILLDLSDAVYMGSAGFRSLHKIYEALKPFGGMANLKLLRPSEQVRRLLKTMGFDAIIKSYEDLNEAVGSF